MIYNDDTGWDLSAKGSWWMRTYGMRLGVSQAKSSCIWVRTADAFFNSEFKLITDTKDPCEREVNT